MGFDNLFDQMKAWGMFLISLSAVGAVVLFGFGVESYWASIEENKCRIMATKAGTDYEYTFKDGCFLEVVNERFVPADNYVGTLR